MRSHAKHGNELQQNIMTSERLLMHSRRIPCFVAIWSLMAASTFAQAEPVDFGRDIQPILAKRCYACHGPDTAEAGLRLNVRESAFAQHESGAVTVVPKQASHSELIKRITSTDDSDRMPPEGKPLTPTQIDLIRRWIDEGADWQEHWAFQKPKHAAVPTVADRAWAAHPVDAFIRAKLDHARLTPAPPASKTALLRRITYDLTGLPPTPAEVEAFLADTSPAAYSKLVDRLLAAPQFGEKWARHWLDVVRYADTNSFERDGAKPNAWRFRDYVIRAFNSDKPYDRFVMEQLAGDELPDGGNDGLIATGYYRLGLWDDEPADRLLAQYDVYDDIITTTGQGFLGLTINCARCHDHKIDPIPTREYYSFVAFFQNLTPNGYPSPQTEQPLFADPASRAAYDAAVEANRKEIDDTQAQITAIEKEFREKLTTRESTPEVPDLDDVESKFYRDTWNKLPNFDDLKPETVAQPERPYFDISAATREFSFGFVFTGDLKVPADAEYTFLLDSDDGSRLSIDGEQILLYDGIHGVGSPKSTKVSLKAGRRKIRVDYFQGPTGDKGLYLSWSGPGFTNRHLSAPSEKGRNARRRDLVAALKDNGRELLGGARFDEYTRLTKSLADLKQNRPAADMALCVTEHGTNAPETVIFKRGNPQSPGDKVVPAFLSSLGGGQAVIATPPSGVKSSGRRSALAQWIASRDNPQTARVMVNRVWQHLFGRGIVRSPNNFGLLGDRPTHPELLDWLAIRFMDDGWRMKSLIKLIVMSKTYQMSSQTNATALEKDPLNNLFWRHDMRRLNAEELRDSILSVSGNISLKQFGPGVYPEISDEVKAGQSNPGQGWGKSSPEDAARRSVYVFVKRSLPLPMLSDFDFPDTDGSCAARFATTQPTQALGMLNGKFLNDQAVILAQRLQKESPNDVTAQIKRAYFLTTGHTPDDAAVTRGRQLIEAMQQKHGVSADRALALFCLMTLNLNEFAYLD